MVFHRREGGVENMVEKKGIRPSEVEIRDRGWRRSQLQAVIRVVDCRELHFLFGAFTLHACKGKHGQN
jgi:hypothetical protein